MGLFVLKFRLPVFEISDYSVLIGLTDMISNSGSPTFGFKISLNS